MKIFLNAPEIENIKSQMEEEIFPGFVGASWEEDPLKADVCILDHSTWEASESQNIDSKAILLSLKDKEFNIVNLLNGRSCFHLIGYSKIHMRELKETLECFNNNSGWDRERIFGSYQDQFKYEFTNSSQIKDKLDYVLGQLNFENYFKYPTDFIRFISNELLMNAFYHGEKGGSRTVEVDTEEKPITFEVGANERGILLRIVDSNGGFDYHKLLESLIRGFKEKTPRHDTEGAGLGLYFVFNMANQFIVNVNEGKGSEIIGIIEANKRYKTYMERVTSLHYHMEKK